MHQASLGREHKNLLLLLQCLATSEIPIQEAKNRMVSKLHDILKPFLLRRVKADVENSLPPKREIVLYAPLTSNQLEIEKKLVNKTLISEIQEQLASKNGRSTILPTSSLPSNCLSCCKIIGFLDEFDNS